MAQIAKWYENCADAAMADAGHEMPTLPTDLAKDITKWGETTFDICRRFGTPTKEAELMMNHFLKALHTSRYCNPEFTHIKHLVHLFFDSLVRAQTKSIPKHTSVPPSSWTWTPSQSSGDVGGPTQRTQHRAHHLLAPKLPRRSLYHHPRGLRYHHKLYRLQHQHSPLLPWFRLHQPRTMM